MECDEKSIHLKELIDHTLEPHIVVLQINAIWFIIVLSEIWHPDESSYLLTTRQMLPTTDVPSHKALSYKHRECPKCCSMIIFWRTSKVNFWNVSQWLGLSLGPPNFEAKNVYIIHICIQRVFLLKKEMNYETDKSHSGDRISPSGTLWWPPHPEAAIHLIPGCLSGHCARKSTSHVSCSDWLSASHTHVFFSV